MGIFKGDTVCRLCSEEEETISHIVLEIKVLAHRQFNLLGLTNKPRGGNPHEEPGK
jgi:hypothetical protein